MIDGPTTVTVIVKIPAAPAAPAVQAQAAPQQRRMLSPAPMRAAGPGAHQAQRTKRLLVPLVVHLHQHHHHLLVSSGIQTQRKKRDLLMPLVVHLHLHQHHHLLVSSGMQIMATSGASQTTCQKTIRNAPASPLGPRQSCQKTQLMRSLMSRSMSPLRGGWVSPTQKMTLTSPMLVMMALDGSI